MRKVSEREREREKEREREREGWRERGGWKTLVREKREAVERCTEVEVGKVEVGRLYYLQTLSVVSSAPSDLNPTHGSYHEMSFFIVFHEITWSWHHLNSHGMYLRSGPAQHRFPVPYIIDPSVLYTLHTV